jgi:hypothetical protein
MLWESHTRETIVAARLESICLRPSISKARKGNKSISHAAVRPNVLRGRDADTSIEGDGRGCGIARSYIIHARPDELDRGGLLRLV